MNYTSGLKTEPWKDGLIVKQYTGIDKKIDIPDMIDGLPVCAIGKESFMGAGIEQVSIPESVRMIGAAAFKDCRALTSVSFLGESMGNIYREAFSGCVSLPRIKLPSDLEVINQQTFQGCTNLESVTLPKNLRRLCSCAFEECEKLKGVSLDGEPQGGYPESLEFVGDKAFDGCKGFDTADLHKKISDTRKSGFAGRTNTKGYFSDIVCKRTGWDIKTVEEKMEEARARGISAKRYVTSMYWQRDEEQRKEYDLIARQSNLKTEKETYLGKICEATGWKPEYAVDMVRKAKQNCGSSYKDYFNFKLHQLSPASQREYLTLSVWESVYLKYNFNLQSKRFVDDKFGFNTKFSQQLGRRWFTNMDLAYEEFRRNVEGLAAIIVKPLRGTQGKGIQKYQLDVPETELASIYRRIAESPASVIEEYLIQNEALSSFAPNSLNTVRVVTILDQGVCHHLYAGFRTGRGGIVDNFHSGGVVATIDTASGVVVHDAVDLSGRHFPAHPVSGLSYRGFKIPLWANVLEITSQAAHKLEDFGMVGWDVAVLEDRAVLIEANSGPSHTIIQLPYVDDKIGMRHIVRGFVEI